MVRGGSAWSRNNRREIRRTLGRYLAIVAIIALGVGFLAGLKLARPAMLQIGREFVAESKLYDFQLLSTLGLTQDDAAYFAAMDGVVSAEGSVSADLLTRIDGSQKVFKTHQLLTQTNQVQLTAGRMPQAANECLGDDLVLTEDQLGLVLPVENEEENLFSQDAYTVVGLCNTAQYLNVQRGSTSLADGSVAGFLYIPADGYDSEYFTELYLRIDGSFDAFSDAYNDAMSSWEQPLKQALTARGDMRKDDVYTEAKKSLDEAQSEYDQGLADYEAARADTDRQLADAKAQLEDAKKQLDDGKAQLADGEQALRDLERDPCSNEELAAARKQLDDGWTQLEQGEARYQQGLAEYEKARAEAEPQLAEAKQQLEDAKKQLDDGWAQYGDGVKEYEESKRKLQIVLAPLNQALNQAESELAQARETLNKRQQALDDLRQDPDADPAQLAAAAAAVEAARAEVVARQAAYTAARQTLDSTTAQLNEQLAQGEAQLIEAQKQLEDGQKQYDQGLQQYEDGVRQLEDAKQQLADANAQLVSARAQLEDGEAQLAEGIETAKTEGRKALEEARKTLEDGEAEYEDGVKAYEDGVAEADARFADAKAQLEDAAAQLADGKKRVEDLKNPSYYVLGRSSNTGYASFDNDTSIVDGVAKIFPAFFFLVAALVCSSTMTRMVEEQRTQNGTLKALGYSDGQIMWRYASYAGSAALLGAGIGYFLCGWLFPLVIWHAYQMLYHFAPIRLLLDWKLGALAVFFALLCSVGAACAAAWSEMRQMPAQLMRPKAPKAGKRIFLEYLTPLWKRLSFLQKVSARNILRYKKRLFMMVLGVGGCMALLIAGLGMRDSISNVAEEQYTDITVYDYAISFSQGQSQAAQDEFRASMDGQLTDCAFAGVHMMDVLTNQGTKSANLVATGDPAITELIDLHDGDRSLGYPSDAGVFVSRKLANMAGVRAGDTITVQTDENRMVELPVEAVFDNYVHHYIFMTDRGYETWFGEPVSYETAFASTGADDVYTVAAQLQNTDGVVNVSVSQSFRDLIRNTLVSLDAVVLLVVGCAVALSFVVSYNLCNINITERTREIATIKVLGFYPNETEAYVFRESVVLTFLGILAGIPMGIWLHRFVLDRIQVDMVSFPIRITWVSYLLAVVLTFAINIGVDLVLRKKIAAIDMAESLKSVE